MEKANGQARPPQQKFIVSAAWMQRVLAILEQLPYRQVSGLLGAGAMNENVRVHNGEESHVPT